MRKSKIFYASQVSQSHASLILTFSSSTSFLYNLKGGGRDMTDTFLFRNYGKGYETRVFLENHFGKKVLKIVLQKTSGQGTQVINLDTTAQLKVLLELLRVTDKDLSRLFEEKREILSLFKNAILRMGYGIPLASLGGVMLIEFTNSEGLTVSKLSGLLLWELVVMW